MGVFTYFATGKTPEEVDADWLAGVGLGAVFADLLPSLIGLERYSIENYGATDNSDSPGKPGTLFYMPPRPEIGWQPQGIRDPRNSEWTNCGGYWLGVQESDKPIAEHLERTAALPGVSVTLGDGQLWTAPTIRKPLGESTVAFNWGVAPDGEFRRTMKPESEKLWELVCWIWEAIYSDDDLEVLFSKLFESCVTLIGANYRVGPNEATALSLFNDTNWRPVFDAAVDYAGCEKLVDELQKKSPEPSRLLDSQDSSTGGIEGSQSGNPQSANSSSQPALKEVCDG